MVQPHLTKLFKVGKDVELEVTDPETGEPVKISLYFRKPSHEQQEQAMAKARAKQARRRRLLKDHESDEYLSLVAGLEEISRGDLIDQHVRFEEQTLRQEAMNWVLYAEESQWSKRDTDYLDLITAMQQRVEELERYNELLPEGSSAEDLLTLDTDEEYQRLLAEKEIFDEEMRGATERLVARYRGELDLLTDLSLQEKMIGRMVDVDSGMSWYQEYRTLMVFFACRNPDDKKKLYFSNSDDLWDLPETVRMKLFAAWEELDSTVDEIKNSLSPLPS